VNLAREDIVRQLQDNNYDVPKWEDRVAFKVTIEKRELRKHLLTVVRVRRAHCCAP
jgi:hypothetical protein